MTLATIPSSIAISIAIAPSRLQTILFAGAALFCTLLALALGSGQVGELAVIARMAIALSPAIAAVMAVRLLRKKNRWYRLDISGSGQIRLSLLAEPRSVPCHQGSAATEPVRPILCRLATGTTLLRPLLLLRLQQQSGRIITLAIFRDSVSEDGFRRLSVACRWVVAQNYRTHEKLL